jgi:tRNA(Ile)-lysidine synthetase-like protein
VHPDRGVAIARARRPVDLATAFADHWKRHFAPPVHAPVVVAVSGGIDSMALLALLARERAGGDLEVVAAHFDHGTRGAESAEDGRFVAAAAARWGARARRGRGDAPARARASGRGPMAAARDLRYRFLHRVVEEEGASILVTAHHRDDLVETVFLRLVRGASPDGIAAFRPLDDLDGTPVARPLLPFRRAAIETWAETTRVPFRDDPSNVDPRYPRVRVRREVVPLLAKLNPRVDEAIVRFAGLAAADAAYLDARAEEALAVATVARGRDAWRLEARRLVDEPDAVLSRAVLRGWAWSGERGSTPPNVEWVEGALEFLRRGRGGGLPCPGGGALERRGREIVFRRPPSRARPERSR